MTTTSPLIISHLRRVLEDVYSWICGTIRLRDDTFCVARANTTRTCRFPSSRNRRPLMHPVHATCIDSSLLCEMVPSQILSTSSLPPSPVASGGSLSFPSLCPQHWRARRHNASPTVIVRRARICSSTLVLSGFPFRPADLGLLVPRQHCTTALHKERRLPGRLSFVAPRYS